MNPKTLTPGEREIAELLEDRATPGYFKRWSRKNLERLQLLEAKKYLPPKVYKKLLKRAGI